SEFGMIPPNSSSPCRQQIACEKKGARRRLLELLLFLLTLERVLYAERESGHVRAGLNSARSTETTTGDDGCRSGGSVVPSGTGDVVVVRAHGAVIAVVDLGVSGEHLGALGHDIVVAYDRHLRLDAAG